MEQKGCLTNRALWPICLQIPFSFFFYSLLTIGTCGKQALWAGETFRGLPVLGQNINKHAGHPFSDFPIYCFTATAGSHYGNCSGSLLWLLLGRVSEQWVQLFLTVKIFWPAQIHNCFFWSLVLKSYDLAHGFLADCPNRGWRGSPCLNCSADFDGFAHGCWVCLPVSPSSLPSCSQLFFFFKLVN